MINTYPLHSITLEEAMQKQFKMVSCIMDNFEGHESLTRGDLGVHQPENQPLTTLKAEKAVAQFFDAEAAIMVRGAGTGAIRYALAASLKANDKILIHDAPVYSTTVNSFEMLGLNEVRANYNDLNDVLKTLKDNPDIKGVLIQHTRQKIDDSYDMEEVIKTIKEYDSELPIVIDDNYAVMKVKKIGSECGADLSCFSTFKLQGPQGIGIVVGKKKYIDNIRKMHYSGGCQTQGFEALEVLRGLTYAPVLLAISNITATNVYNRLKAGEIKDIKDAYIANAQSKVLLVEFERPIAKKVLAAAEKRGALPNPVGAESKYEIAPLFYRVSGTFLKADPSYGDHMIRINPNRCGEEKIMEILKESIKEVMNV